MKKQFKFSVIVPIYNVEEYLEETIESVINQTIGFEDNIELILINDGSPDDSEKICLKYQELYPDNIIYYKQKNAGVSAARNKGIELASGELINFLDSDDKWSLNTFKIVYDNYLEHQDVHVFSTKMRYFDAQKGNHVLNYKYKNDKIIDIREDYQYIQLSTCSCFITKDVIKNYKYDLETKNEEDTRLINEILFKEYKMMILSKPVYYYRRRRNQTSASQNSLTNNPWYTVTPHKVYEYLFEKSEKEFGKVLDYVKFLVAYDIGWRLTTSSMSDLITEKEQKDYIKCITNLIKKIDFDFFKEQKNIPPTYLMYIYNIKYNKDISTLISIKDGDVICNLLEEPKNKIKFMQIDDIYIEDNILQIIGRINQSLYSKDKIKFIVDGEEQEIEYYELHNNFDEISFSNEKITSYYGIDVKVDINKVKEFGFVYNKNNDYLNLSFSNQSNLTNLLKGSYYVYKNKMVTLDKGKFKISNRSIFKCIGREFKNIFGLIGKGKIKQLILRLLIILSKPFAPKNIWLLSDRVNVADDNAEHLFKYINENHREEVNAYYVISKDCKDFERMKQYGKVIDNNSLKYKFLFVNADYIISSHAEVYITNLFGKNNQYYKDLFKFKYVFLQHGITQNDISSWLNPNTKHIDMFVSAVQKEYDSLCTYGYNKNVIQLTGFPRYDGLVTKKSQYELHNTIMVSFTWRSNIANKIDRITGARLYNEKFKNTDYYKWINNLLNDKKLHKVLKDYNYKIRFIPHPNVLPQLKDFELNEYVEIAEGNINYQKEFCENKLLITDYSSVYFDFGYLKKPVLYFQPDRETFYEGQIYNKGYFDYNTMGFGPCCTDYDDFIKELINLIKKDCKLEKKYEKRIDDFFTYHDANNCERVYNKIKKLKGE